MPRVMIVYGTRPEAIKVAPLIAALEADSRFDPIVAVTGQHREMLDQVNDLFGIKAHHDLDLMRPGASLVDLASRALVCYRCECFGSTARTRWSCRETRQPLSWRRWPPSTADPGRARGGRAAHREPRVAIP